MTRRSHRRLAGLLASAWCLVAAPGCGAALPRAPATPNGDDGFTVQEVDPPGMDPGGALPLSLAPGDVVTLRLQAAEVERIEGLTVDERGVLHVPLAGDVEVAGLPLTEAEERVEAAMRPFVSAVRASLILSDPRGQQASVLGAVVEQGRVQVVPGMRVTDLLAAAGGVSSPEDGATAASDLHAARLVRGGRALPISVALAMTGDPRHNVPVRAGDHLYVPPQLGTLISVIGEVGGARVLAYRPGLRLSQALAMAGGITRNANGGDIRIVRGPSDRPSVYRAAIDHVVAGHHADPVLAPGDIVHVGSSALADFRDVMAAIAPIVTLLATSGVGVAVGFSRP